MSTTYAPIMICDHGIAGKMSFHANNAEAHARNWHTMHLDGETARPMNARIGTREEHEAAGWDVSNYPESIAL